MKKIRKNTLIKISLCAVLVMIICAFAAIPVFAEGDTGNVAQAIENTWTAAKGQVQTVVNNQCRQLKIFDFEGNEKIYVF